MISIGKEDKTMPKMTNREKTLLDGMTPRERREYLRAHRKPPIPAPRTFDARCSARRKDDRREKRERRELCV